jgi:group I intron endonuclease
VNGKIYIGQTSYTVEKRFKTHLFNAEKGSHFAIYRAIRKYGKENFSVESLCSCHYKKNVDRLEIMLIKKFDSMNTKFGYNMVSGGQGGVPNQEVRDKISKFFKGKKHSPECC